MTMFALCGTRRPAAGYDRYCAVCDALERAHCDDDELWKRATDLIFDRCERITRLHRAYGRRRR